MDDRVWVGPASSCPPGWTGYESVDALVAASNSPRWIVLDDRAAVLREADFSRLYQHAPLARIERIVGPWRAGVGRTDCEWPLTTTRWDDFVPDVGSLDEVAWYPLTSGYDELSAEGPVPDLSGFTFGLQITDPELRGMWTDWLMHSAGEVTRGRVDVLIRDNSPGQVIEAPAANRCVVTLCVDPWNATQAQADARPATERASVTLCEIAASYLDPPARVMQRVLAAIQRATS